MLYGKIGRAALLQLIYANPAAAPITDVLNVKVGDSVPEEFHALLRRILATEPRQTIEIQSGERIFSLLAVPVPDFGFINIYGTDITASRALEIAHRRLEEQSREIERLLHSILPASIVERLQRGETTIADRHCQVSVLFADIVGFTQLTSELSPSQTVDFLNRLFTTFDQLTERYGLEKIKTVGDAYMVVGGLPSTRQVAWSLSAPLARFS